MESKLYLLVILALVQTLATAQSNKSLIEQKLQESFTPFTSHNPAPRQLLNTFKSINSVCQEYENTYFCNQNNIDQMLGPYSEGYCCVSGDTSSQCTSNSASGIVCGQDKATMKELFYFNVQGVTSEMCNYESQSLTATANPRTINITNIVIDSSNFKEQACYYQLAASSDYEPNSDESVFEIQISVAAIENAQIFMYSGFDINSIGDALNEGLSLESEQVFTMNYDQGALLIYIPSDSAGDESIVPIANFEYQLIGDYYDTQSGLATGESVDPTLGTVETFDEDLFQILLYVAYGWGGLFLLCCICCYCCNRGKSTSKVSDTQEAYKRKESNLQGGQQATGSAQNLQDDIMLASMSSANSVHEKPGPVVYKYDRNKQKKEQAQYYQDMFDQ